MVICAESIYIASQKKYLKIVNAKYIKFKKYYQLYNKWLENNEKGINIAEKLKKHGYNKIAIYGNGEIGNRLYEQLKKTEVDVLFFIDKSSSDIEMINKENIEIKALNSLVSNDKCLDCIIVTPIHEFEQIKKEMEIMEIKHIPIISIEDIVYI